MLAFVLHSVTAIRVSLQIMEAYVFVCGLIRQAKKKIVLVDRYVDEKTLTMMLKREKGVSVTIYTYDKSKVFEVDLSMYNAQYAECPVKILPSYGMHDRFLWYSCRVPTIRLSNVHASVVAPFALNGCYR